MVCESCGGEVGANARHCPACGHAVMQPAGGSATTAEPLAAPMPPTPDPTAPDTTGSDPIPPAADPPTPDPTRVDPAESFPPPPDPDESFPPPPDPDESFPPPPSPVADTATPVADGAVHATDAEAATEPGSGELVIDAPERITVDDQIFDPPTTPAVTSPSVASTTVVDQVAPPTARVARTDEVPALFDGQTDIDEHPAEREPFKFRLVFVFAFFGAIAVALVPAANVIDIRTSRPVDGIEPGFVTLDQFGSNLAVASYVGAGAMVLGGLIACWGMRWAAGIAGGAGLALIGWAGLVIGVVEARLEVAEEITRNYPADLPQYELSITRDLGYGLIVAVAALGLLVFIASLRLSRTAGRPGLNPWIAAIGAVSALVLAVGPAIPVDGASFSDNFRSTASSGDLPTAYLGGRVGQLLLIGMFAAIGFLLVRTYGLGLAAGSVSVAAWLWFSSLAELGDAPLGIADMNPGAGDTTPHAVTTVGMVLTLAMLLVAAIAALAQYRRYRRR
jgi:hypothetical protein